ncbi:primosomal protein N' [Nocardioides insulae]|uniref:primosomal protein N' n=1 Tax=Nocardioides insulae TaxID=394734 RepID=UPI000418B15A|nr:primosomal protein N' [Nocardioides insulae]
MTPEEEPALELPGLARDRVREGRRKAAATRARRAAEQAIAEVDPVARVLVDVSLPHLDRLFDYSVPAAMAEQAVPGARVKVRFAGKDVDGFLIDRVAISEHAGRLQPLRRVVSAERVLTAQVAALAAEVAARYAGSRPDVIRLAVPPRHAATEKQPSVPAPEVPADAEPARAQAKAARAAWAGHEPAEAFLAHVGRGGSPRGVWQAAAGTDWPLLIAHAVGTARAAGRGALVCVPDGRDVARVDAALTAVLGEDQHVTLRADSGPAARYRDFLSLARGARRVVVGPRAAAFAPVRDLGLIVVWDDGDDLLAEPRAPYPHARDTLVMRAELEGSAMLLGGFARSVEADQLVGSGWAHELRPTREVARSGVRVGVAGASDHDLERDPLTRVSRVPGEVHRLIRDALSDGPVLVQTPRRGYAAALSCDRCREPARCAACRGPLRLTGPSTPPACGWCGATADPWSCPECGGRGLRAPVVGESRTAEELGRAFPGVRVSSSAGERVLATVPGGPGIVVATPGAEPVAEGGYAAVVMLDCWLLLSRPDLRTAEEAVRRWSNAVGLVRSGGQAIAVGDPAEPALQALVRWDQPGFARREAAERREAHLPPASRLATLTGEPGALDDALTLLAVPDHAEVLGPVPTGRSPEEARAVVRVPHADGAALSAALLELQRLRSARKLDPIRVQVDPPSL